MSNTPRKTTPPTADTNATLGFEDKLWAAADVLRNNMDPAEYKHVVLGLIFLKYISDAFEERQQQLIAAGDEDLLEDRDEYTAENVFWVPPAARWANLQGLAKQPTIGKALDDAMDAVEIDNPVLKGALPKVYAMPALDKHKLGELIDLISGIGLGTAAHREKDTLGRVYEYFLSRFASAEGRGGGEFYTPSSIVRVLVEMLEPYAGRVYDPCCGSGGMFVQSVKFIDAHGGQRNAVTVHGQESNATTWRMARMNMAIRGIEAKLGKQHGDTFHRDLHPDLRADFVMANPPFNISNWGGERLTDDVRWKFGVPPAGNANFAWLQHIVHHLAPTGTAGVVLANGSMSSQQSGEGEIRKSLVKANLVDCMVAMPGQLFYATQIPVCLWFLARDKGNTVGAAHRGGPTTAANGNVDTRTGGDGAPPLHHDGPVGAAHRGGPHDAVGAALRGGPHDAVGAAHRGGPHRSRKDEVLFIDARKLGRMESRVHRVLDAEDIEKIAATYHAWRNVGGDYADIPGFCKAATLAEIEAHDFVLTPGRYVGAEEVEDDGEPFEAKMERLVAALREQQAEGRRLDVLIGQALGGLGYGG